MSLSRGFGSDNHAGIHPEVLAAIAAVNEGHATPYGADETTRQAQTLLSDLFGESCHSALVFNGTGANCVSFASTARTWESVICAETAHINSDECGAPEKVAGVKLVPVATADGKLTPELVAPHLRGFGFEHHAQPRHISISNVTELGTVYSPEEVAALARQAHDHGMLLHCDGARLANAAVGLGCSMRELTTDAGVDVVSLGGTKNGMLLGEAVIFCGNASHEHAAYVRKQSTQLASKMRFLSAQFLAMFGTDLWERCARNANQMATRLAEGAMSAGIEIAHPVQANEIFAFLPQQAATALGKEYRFYVWDETVDDSGRQLVRWVTSWDTQPSDVDTLVADLVAVSGR